MARAAQLQPPGFREQNHGLPHLESWINACVGEDLSRRLHFSPAAASCGGAPPDPAAGARRRGAPPPSGSDFGDLLVTRAQIYTLCHDEVCRHVALHCAPLAGLSVKLWAALAGVADAALRAYEDAHAECVEYRAQLGTLVGNLSAQLEELRGARGALAARLERAEGTVVELRARLRAAGKEAALALEEAAGCRATAFASATGLGGGGG